MTLAFLVAAWLTGLLLGRQFEVTALPILLLVLATFSLWGLLRLSGRAAIPAVMAGVLLFRPSGLTAGRELSWPFGRRTTVTSGR